jgi:hypothetical protein
VVPSEDTATLLPKAPSPISSPLFGMSFSASWVQVEPERVNAQAAPTPLLSDPPPTSPVLPSEERATL